MSTVVNVNAVNLDLKQLSGYYIKGEEMNADKIGSEIIIIAIAILITSFPISMAIEVIKDAMEKEKR